MGWHAQAQTLVSAKLRSQVIWESGQNLQRDTAPSVFLNFETYVMCTCTGNRMHGPTGSNCGTMTVLPTFNDKTALKGDRCVKRVIDATDIITVHVMLSLRVAKLCTHALHEHALLCTRECAEILPSFCQVDSYLEVEGPTGVCLTVTQILPA